ncbi:Putative tricorn protease OS=Streptomyces antimycoticus OX=68175 GN=tri2 PE=3 SV=1 [Streptomyces antimycoticus]
MRRIQHTADPAAESRRQAYDEAGRITRHYFWDPGMCGVDWDGVLSSTVRWSNGWASPDEFADLLARPSASWAPRATPTSPPRAPQQGPALAPHRTARRQPHPHQGRPVGGSHHHLLPGRSSDSRARSPLAGLGIRNGAVLTHVDGRPVDPVAGPYPLLTAAARRWS